MTTLTPFPTMVEHRVGDLLEALWDLQDMHRELIRETERLAELLDGGAG